MTELTAERLRQVLDYNPVTGVFRWKSRLQRRTKIGDVAGRVANNGYRQIGVDGEQFLAHRLAWFWMTGLWPKSLDHCDRDRDHNWWANLREATTSQNAANRKLSKRSTTGFTGVCRVKNSPQFWAQIKKGKANFYLGKFDSAEAAHAAYLAKSKELFGEFASEARRC